MVRPEVHAGPCGTWRMQRKGAHISNNVFSPKAKCTLIPVLRNLSGRPLAPINLCLVCLEYGMAPKKHYYKTK